MSGGDDGGDMVVEAGVDDSSHLSWTWVTLSTLFPKKNL